MTTTTLQLPDGIAEITNEDYGCGPCLRVKLASGRIVLIDALELSGEYEAQIGVYEPGWDTEDSHHPVAGLAFNATGPVKHHDC